MNVDGGISERERKRQTDRQRDCGEERKRWLALSSISVPRFVFDGLSPQGNHSHSCIKRMMQKCELKPDTNEPKCERMTDITHLQVLHGPTLATSCAPNPHGGAYCTCTTAKSTAAMWPATAARTYLIVVFTTIRLRLSIIQDNKRT